MKYIPKSVIDKAYSYQSYRQMLDELFADNKTTGNDHSEAMLDYAKLNLSRMKRLDKKSRLTDETLEGLAKMERSVIWLVITEGWCGDAAQIVPVLNHMANENEHISMKFIMRDENLGIMDAFLTNGGRSIPKILVLDTVTFEVLTTWGPRPQVAQEIVLSAKVKANATDDLGLKTEIQKESAKDLHLWYAKDKTRAIQEEFLGNH